MTEGRLKEIERHVSDGYCNYAAELITEVRRLDTEREEWKRQAKETAKKLAEDRDALAVQIATLREALKALARYEQGDTTKLCWCYVEEGDKWNPPHDEECEKAKAAIYLDLPRAARIAEALFEVVRAIGNCNHNAEANHIYTAEDARRVCKLCIARTKLAEAEGR